MYYSPKVAIIKQPTYLFQLIEENNFYSWEACVSFEQRQSETSYDLKNCYSSNKQIINLQLKSIENPKDILKRMVFIEKIGCKKTIKEEGDPLINWALNQLFSSSLKVSHKDFILSRINNKLQVDKVWYLSDCAIIKSNLLNNFFESIDDSCNNENMSLSIIPGTILSP